jgi:hypothetical protein
MILLYNLRILFVDPIMVFDSIIAAPNSTCLYLLQTLAPHIFPYPSQTYNCGNQPSRKHLRLLFPAPCFYAILQLLVSKAHKNLATFKPDVLHPLSAFPKPKIHASETMHASYVIIE